MLFIDARNYYTVERFKNIPLCFRNIALYLAATCLLPSRYTSFQSRQKISVLNPKKREKKKIQEGYDTKLAELTDILTIAKEANWLYGKFGDGTYVDILGLCKVADTAEIEAKSWSLTPGVYVGVAPVEDDGVGFEERMAKIHREMLSLQAESNDLMDIISQNLEEMGL